MKSLRCRLGFHHWKPFGKFTHPIIQMRLPTLEIVRCARCGEQRLRDGEFVFTFEEINIGIAERLRSNAF